jgi:hypothetical protein
MPKVVKFTAGTTSTVQSITAPTYNASDPKFARNAGTAGNYFTAPNETVTGSKTFTFDIRAETYLPASDIVLASKLSGNNGFEVKLRTDGKLQLTIGDGASLTSITSTAATGIADAIRATLEVAWTDGASASFSVNGTALGTAVTAVKTLTSAAVVLTIGPWVGDLYRAQVGSIYDMDLDSWVSGNTFLSAAGETWTRAGEVFISPEFRITSITSSAHTLVWSGTGMSVIDHGNVSYSTASPVRTWAMENGTNGTGNTNWLVWTDAEDAASQELFSASNVLSVSSSPGRSYSFTQASAKSVIDNVNGLTTVDSPTRQYSYIRS